MTDTPSLFDPTPLPPAVEGARRRDAAVRRVGDAAPDPWWDQALGAVKDAAQQQPGGFTTDDVWRILEHAGLDAPPEPRALGAVMTAARRAGIIRPTDRYAPTVRPGAHRRPVRVWIGA